MTPPRPSLPLPSRAVPERLTLRAPEVARLLGVSRTLVYDWIKHDRIPHVRIGDVELVPVAELDDWLARHTQAKGA